MGVFADMLYELADYQAADQLDAKSGKSSTMRELEAGFRDQLSTGAQALSSLTGSDALRKYSEEQERLANLRRSRSEYVQSWDDVNGVSDLASYTAKNVISSVPAIAGMALGGGVAGVGAKAAGYGLKAARAAQVTGALATQELQSIGEVQKAQIEQSGDYDGASSVVLGTASNLLNLAGVEGMVVRGLPKSMLASRTKRAAVSAGRTAAEESAAEVGQQFMSEAGRRVVDEEFDVLGSEARGRYKEAAIGGALAGGAIGGATGAVSSRLEEQGPPARITLPQPNAQQSIETAGTPVEPEPPQSPEEKAQAQRPIQGPPAPAPRDDLAALREQEPKPPKAPTFKEIAEQITGGKDRKPSTEVGGFITKLRTKMSAGQLDAAAALIEEFDAATAANPKLGKKALTERQAAASRAATMLKAYGETFEKYGQDKLAWEQLLDEATKPPAGTRAPPARITLPQPNAQQSIETAGTPVEPEPPQSPEEKAQAQRAALLQSVLPLKDPVGKFKELLRVNNMVGHFTLAESQVLTERIQGVNKNEELRANMEGMAELREAAMETAEPIAEPEAPAKTKEPVEDPKYPGQFKLDMPVDPEERKGRKYEKQANRARETAAERAAAIAPTPEPAPNPKAPKQMELFESTGRSPLSDPRKDLRDRVRERAKTNKTVKELSDRADRVEALARKLDSKKTQSDIEDTVTDIRNRILGSKFENANSQLIAAEATVTAAKKKPADPIGPIEPQGPKEPTTTTAVRFLDDAGIAARVLRLVDEGVLTDDEGREMVARSRKNDAAAVKVEKEIFTLEGKGTAYMPARNAPSMAQIEKMVADTQATTKNAQGRSILDNLLDRVKSFPGFDTAVMARIVDAVGKNNFKQANALFENESGRVNNKLLKEEEARVKSPEEIRKNEAQKKFGLYVVKNFELLSQTAVERAQMALDTGDYDSMDLIIDQDVERIDKMLAKQGTPRGTGKSIGLPATMGGKPVYMPAREGMLGFKNNSAMSVAEVKYVVDKVVSAWKNLPRIIIIDTRNPRNWFETDIITQNGGEFRGMLAYSGSEPVIVLNGDYLESYDDVEATIYHEALGHYGLRSAYGRTLQKLLRDIYESDPKYKSEIMKRIAHEHRVEAETVQLTPYDIGYHMEEILAEKSEAGPLADPTTLQRVMDFIRGFARRMGWRKGAFTEAELSAIVRAGQKRTMDGPKAPNRDVVAAARIAFRPVASGDSAPAGPTAILQDTKTPDQKIRDSLTRFGAPEYAIGTAITARSLARKHFQGMLFGKDLVDFIKPLLKTYGAYQEKMQLKSQISNEYNRAIDQLIVEANNLGTYVGKDGRKAKQVDALTTFMQNATLSNKWGYEPKWLTERKMVGGKWTTVPKTVTVDPDQEIAYKALPSPEARAIADRFFEMGFKSREELRTLVRKQMDAETEAEVKKARNTSDERAIRRQRNRAANLFDNRVPSLAGPYVPLSRFGNYLTVGRSKQLAALEDLPKPTAEEEEEMRSLRAKPEHYYVSMHDTAGQAEADKQLLMQQFPEWAEPYAGAKEEFYGSRPEAGWMAMQKLKDTVKDQLDANPAFDAKTVHSINMMLRDLYYSSLAEDSARKHDLKREGVPGVKHAELLQAIATKGRADGHFIAALTYNDEMTQHLQEMREEANINDARKSDRKMALNEVIARHTRGMEFESTPFYDKVVAASAFYYLLTLPRYYIQNGLQTFMVTAPVLAARYGGNAYSAIFDAYKVFKPVLNSVEGLKDFASGKFDVDQLGLKADEAEYLKHLRKIGLIDIGLNYDMGYWESSDNPISKNMSEMTHWFRTKSQQIEVLNRVSAGLATYRLARAANKSDADARLEATNMIYQTHGDYSMSNAPRYLNMLPKVITQFRKYQLIQVSLLARNVYNAFAGASAPEKLVARKTLAFLLGQTAVVTGALGLPAVQGLAYAMSMAFGDEEEPVDGERMLREWIGNEDMANLLLKGVPAAAGVDVSSNLGMGTALSILPFTDFDPTREGYDKMVTDLGGPAVAMGRNMWEGMAYLRNGDYQKGVEMMIPTGPREALRTYRLAFQEGLTKKNGDMLLTPDEFSWGETFAMAMGFKPTQLVNRGRVQGDLIEYDEYFKGRTAQLKKAYAYAEKNSDIAAMGSIREQWTKVQESKKSVGLKPSPMGDLLKARREQARRERQTVGGVQVTKSNRQFVEASLGE